MDGRALLWVFPEESLHSSHTPRESGVGSPENGLPRLEEVLFAREHFVGELLQRGDVIHHEDAAAVGPYDEVTVTGVHDHIVDAHGGETCHERLPALPLVERNEEAELGSSIQDALVPRVLFHDVDAAKGRKVGPD